MKTYNVLVLGASYGSLLATKLALGGNNVTLVCLPTEAEIINREGTVVRMPIKGREGLVEVRSKDLKGKIDAKAPGEVDVSKYDIVGLAMQEPQYGGPGVKDLMDKIAAAKIPCMSIMNMPPLTFMKRVPGVDASQLRSCYARPDVWDNFDPAVFTLCSPDPQAFRPPEEGPNVLQVTLPTNFKAAAFDGDKDTQIIRDMEQAMIETRFPVDGQEVELPVKLKAFDSVFVPMAKWAMLLTGNYRCVQRDAPRAIKEAVHSDLEQSREVYDWVKQVCIKLGAAEEDLVPFEKYAAAAQGLAKPSSAARALFAGAPNIERVDRLVQLIARQHGMSNPTVDETVAMIDERLEANRRAQESAA